MNWLEGRWHILATARASTWLAWALWAALLLAVVVLIDFCRQIRHNRRTTSLLTYFRYASAETHPDAVRAEIERTNQAAKEIQDRWHSGHHDKPAGASGRPGGAEPALGKG